MSETGLMVDISRCDQLVKLERSKARLEEELKKTNKDIEALWEPILSDITRAGLKNVSLKSGERLQPFRTLRCTKRGGADTRAAVDALKNAGLDWMCTEAYSVGSMKEYLKVQEDELKEAGEIPDNVNSLLPESVRPFFTITELNKIVVYGAKANAGKE